MSELFFVGNRETLYYHSPWKKNRLHSIYNNIFSIDERFPFRVGAVE